MYCDVVKRVIEVSGSSFHARSSRSALRRNMSRASKVCNGAAGWFECMLP
jgi:hypothetical protein